MKNFLFTFLIIILIIWSCFIEPNQLVVTNYTIQNQNLKGLKIVFASDFHIKPNQSERLKKIVDLINEQQPDLVLSVGDFVAESDQSKTMPIEDIARELKNIKSKYGFYTVLGNHDYWQGGNKITATLKQNGIKVLANNSVKVKNFYIAGVEDLMTRKPDLYSALNNTHQPTILLTHSPDVFPEVPKSVTLTLAGHVHGGQIRLPLLGALIVPSKYHNKYSQGLIEEDGKTMIVTKGIGTSTLRIRFNCTPEIVVITFE